MATSSGPTTLDPDGGFVEVGDRVWVARHSFVDVNVAVVGGERGLVVVDTHASEPTAREVADAVRRLGAPGARDVVAVVNTHVHFDHTFGNAVFADDHPQAEMVCHEAAADALPEHAATTQHQARRDAERGGDPRYADVARARVVVPDHTFSSARSLDLGDRAVELVHPGRGHTAGDLVVRVPDAEVLLAGDLIEESGSVDGTPGFGEDCWPMEWPFSLDLVLQLLGEATVVVPGHGSCVGRDFVLGQRSSIGVVAETIRDLAGRGVPVAEALETGEWPYPSEALEHAVRRGYEHLPRSSRSLPML